MKKKTITIIALVAIIALTAAFAACENFNTQNDAFYVRVAINPEVEFAVGENNIVEAVYAANEDAEILLSDTDLTGMDIEDAVEKLVQMAAESGYIDEDSEDNTVEIEVIGEKNCEKLENGLVNRINRYFNNNGIFGNVSLSTLEQYAVRAAELGLPLGKTKMILKALDLNPDLSIDELKDMEMKELVALFRAQAGKGLDSTARAQFGAAQQALRSEYSNIDALQEEIDTLKALLLSDDTASELKAEIAAQLAQKEEEKAALMVQYKAQQQSLLQEHQAKNAQIKEQRRAQKQSRIAVQAAKKSGSKSN